ncbi:unnamed protein product [Pleuronectes platessa]|uniref:Uncharacterized protein n=1 Tax=Pleuronectes platessa TaxID=8262 RepID=A0A9N7UWX8_PLEPL|nr:unnamed protein product [Pleuronectes platessa]
MSLGRTVVWLLSKSCGCWPLGGAFLLVLCSRSTAVSSADLPGLQTHSEPQEEPLLEMDCRSETTTHVCGFGKQMKTISCQLTSRGRSVQIPRLNNDDSHPRCLNMLLG